MDSGEQLAKLMSDPCSAFTVVAIIVSLPCYFFLGISLLVDYIASFFKNDDERDYYDSGLQ